jgi:SAM-dependent methyltransferase
MSLSLQDWHRRFTQQARWTRDIRHYLFHKGRIEHAVRILDVGCGTGALQPDVEQLTASSAYCLEFDLSSLKFLRDHQSKPILTQGDAHKLPYATDAFDLCFCHFVLLWLSNPDKAIAEMRRVTRQGGSVIALAEPDYGGRIDYPAPLAGIGALQREALRRQGADYELGRKLRSIFSGAGFLDVEAGVLGGQWNDPPSVEDQASEWSVIERDLETLEAHAPERERFANLKQEDASAWRTGERVLYVPTFFAIGTVPRG